MIAAQRADGRKPVLACWMGEASVAEARELLSSSGIPDFTTPERAVEAFSHLAAARAQSPAVARAAGPAALLGRPRSGGRANDHRGRARRAAVDAVRHGIQGGPARLRHTDRADDRGREPREGAGRRRDAGLSRGAEDQLAADRPQIRCRRRPHRNRRRSPRCDSAFLEITAAARAARPDAEILGVTVEKMAALPHARELLVGVTRDPVFGPMIAFGAGGTHGRGGSRQRRRAAAADHRAGRAADREDPRLARARRLPQRARRRTGPPSSRCCCASRTW